MGMIGCRGAVERLWTYLDDELDEVGRQAVDEHLAYCLRCCGEVAFARELRETLAARSKRDLPDDVRTRLEGFIGRLEEPTGTN